MFFKSLRTARLLRYWNTLDARPDNGWRTTEEGNHFKLNKNGDVVAGPKGMVGGNVNKQQSQHETASERPKNAAYKAKLSQDRETLHTKSMSKQALFAYESGVAGYDEAVEAMNNKTADRLVDKYFDIMEENGDPTPTKPLRKQIDKQMADEIRQGQHGGDWQQARLDYIQDWAGMSPEESKRTLNQLETWFGGGWSRADTDTLDAYIDADGTYDGELYRGMHFEEDEYQQFMSGIEPGSRIKMQGMNSSWTTDPEVAWLFSKNGSRHVVIHCLKNKTAAPVAHLSMKGEDEVLAHSKAQWTVLRCEEGANRTEIYVVEAEDRMSTEERDQRKNRTNDSAIPKDNYTSLEERMNEQNAYMQSLPPSPELKAKLNAYGKRTKQ